MSVRKSLSDTTLKNGSDSMTSTMTIAIVVNTATSAASSSKRFDHAVARLAESETGGLARRAGDGLFGHGSPPRLSPPIAFP